MQLPGSVESAFIRFQITNTLLSDTAVVLKVTLPVERMILYEGENSGLQKIGSSGNTISFSQLSINRDEKLIQIPLRSGETQTFILWQQLSLHSRLNIPMLQTEDQASLEEFHFQKT